MEPMNWPELLAELEIEYANSIKEKMRAQNLLKKVTQMLSTAELSLAEASVIDRLDMMQMELTEAAKENICRNTRCPHYSKKCKMR